MIKVYNQRRTYLLTAEDGTKHIVPPMAFDQIEEKFTADITFKAAVACGEITIFETAKQGEAIERKAREPKKQPAKAEKKAPEAEKKAADA